MAKGSWKPEHFYSIRFSSVKTEARNDLMPIGKATKTPVFVIYQTSRMTTAQWANCTLKAVIG
jgi:hypothetical protein